MPRRKKDGRYINYYIDREIFERLERYALEKGQQMTTAIERILKEHLDRYDDEKSGGDWRVLAEKETMWAGALADVLRRNGIPAVTRNVLGEGLSAAMGPALERTRVYVPADRYEEALELERGFFAGDEPGG